MYVFFLNCRTDFHLSPRYFGKTPESVIKRYWVRLLLVSIRGIFDFSNQQRKTHLDITRSTHSILPRLIQSC